MASEQELADMERMSNDYVPDVQVEYQWTLSTDEPVSLSWQGPLVGEQQSTQALVNEYAQADPIYVHKTRALPSKYSHYRTVRGDGNCGWRALAFGYFETLLRLRDPAKVRAEIARLKSCNNMMDAVGFSDTVYEDFADVTFELLEQTAASLPHHDGGASLLASFNEPSVWSAISYHFRLLTSAYMKLNPTIYEDFLAGIDVATYCQQNIEPYAVELDHYGLQGLATSVINEAGIAIEVLYLDRSEGEEVNTHQLPVLDGEGKTVEGTPIIRLLYRPGHYDLLYKSEDVTEMAIGAFANPEIRLVSNPAFELSRESQYSQCDDLTSLMDVPGFTFGDPLATPFLSEPYQNQSQPPPIASTATMPSPTMDIRSTLAHTTLGPAAIESLTPGSKSTSPDSAPSPERAADDKFRISNQQLEYLDHRAEFRSQQSRAGFTEDSPDMSKREDPAHYTNEAFQPQIWRPGAFYENETSGRSS